jgi:hypothetical protein
MAFTNIQEEIARRTAEARAKEAAAKEAATKPPPEAPRETREAPKEPRK